MICNSTVQFTVDFLKEKEVWKFGGTVQVKEYILISFVSFFTPLTLDAVGLTHLRVHARLQALLPKVFGILCLEHLE